MPTAAPSPSAIPSSAGHTISALSHATETQQLGLNVPVRKGALYDDGYA
jgi:hypothetical protein